MNSIGVKNLTSSTITRAVLLNVMKLVKVLMYWSRQQTRDQNIGVRVLSYITKTRHMTYS